jgi:hypothetical protein
MNVKDLLELVLEHDLPLDTELTGDSDDCVGITTGIWTATLKRTGETVIVLGTDREAEEIE